MHILASGSAPPLPGFLDSLVFAIGHFGGRALVLRWGRYARLTEQRLGKAEACFDRHRAWIITIARFIEVLRQVNGIIAGITRMHWARRGASPDRG